MELKKSATTLGRPAFWISGEEGERGKVGLLSVGDEDGAKLLDRHPFPYDVTNKEVVSAVIAGNLAVASGLNNQAPEAMEPSALRILQAAQATVASGLEALEEANTVQPVSA